MLLWTFVCKFFVDIGFLSFGGIYLFVPAPFCYLCATQLTLQNSNRGFSHTRQESKKSVSRMCKEEHCVTKATGVSGFA